MVSKTKIVLILACLLLTALPLAAKRKKGEPDQVVVQHILIGFKKSLPGRTLERSRKQARALAESLLARAEEGEDFDALVKEYTDDQYPGKYLMINDEVKQVRGATKRSSMVARFGDVAFSLEVDQVDMAAHHAALSPFGWHIIKRLE